MAITDENKVRARFIKKTLEAEGDDFLKRQTNRITSTLHMRTGRLLSGRKILVYGGNDEFDAKMTLDHPAYERFLDIRHLSNQRKGHKRNIHNRLIFSTYGKIAERLMWGFTDDVRETLKSEIDAIRQSILSSNR